MTQEVLYSYKTLINHLLSGKSSGNPINRIAALRIDYTVIELGDSSGLSTLERRELHMCILNKLSDKPINPTSL